MLAAAAMNQRFADLPRCYAAPGQQVPGHRLHVTSGSRRCDDKEMKHERYPRFIELHVDVGYVFEAWEHVRYRSCTAEKGCGPRWTGRSRRIRAPYQYAGYGPGAAGEIARGCAWHADKSPRRCARRRPA